MSITVLLFFSLYNGKISFAHLEITWIYNIGITITEMLLKFYGKYEWYSKVIIPYINYTLSLNMFLNMLKRTCFKILKQ